MGGPALGPGETRIYMVTGSCNIPPESLVVALNLVVVLPASGGHAKMFAGDAPTPSTSVLNFSAGQIRANNAIVRLASNSSGTIALMNNSGGTADFVIDVSGYFAIACPMITLAPPGPALPAGTSGTPYSQLITASGGSGTYTFALTAGALPMGLTLASGGLLSGTPGVAGDFSFTVTATDSATGCTGSQAYTLHIACGTLTVLITPTPAQVCSGSAGNSASATAGFATYSWSITNGTIQGSTTGQTISYTAGASGNVGLTVNVTDASACAGQGTANVPINALPAPPPIATNNPQTFTVSGASGTFTLTFNGQTTGPLAFNATAAGVQSALNALSSIGGVGGSVAVSQAGGVYTVTFGGTLTGPQPQMTASGAGGCTVVVSPPSVCSGSTGNLARGPAGATTYAWMITNGTITSAANVQTITYTAGASGTVTLDLTVTNASGCAASNSAILTINALPGTPTITPTPAQVCANSTGNTADGPAGATTYAWTITNGTITSATNIQTITYTAGASGNVTLNLTVTNASNCAASNSLDVPINAAPATPTITPTPTEVCAGSTGNQATGPAGATTYAWSITNGTITSATNIQTITYTAGVAAGNVGLTLVVTNAQGCSASNTVNVTKNPTPVFTPSAGALSVATFNVAYPLTFAGTTGTPPHTFVLASGSLPPGMTLNSNGTVSPNTPSVTGPFAFSITDTDAKGCSSTQAYTLNVQPNLQPDAYSGVGNTQLFIIGVAGAPTTPAVSSPTDVLANDSPPGIVVTAGTTACGGIGGSITIDSAGRFIYTPAVNTTGLAICTYTGTSNTIAATGTINITLTNKVWYVNSSGANGDGRSQSPFNNMNNADTSSGANDYVFVHTGGATTTGSISLAAGQTLWGQGTTFTLGPLTIASGAKPTLTGTVTLGGNNITVSSLDISTGASTGLANTGTITGVTIKNNVAMTTTTGTAVLLSNVDSTAGGAPNNGINFLSVSSNGAANGISLTNVNVGNGSFTVAGNGGSCTSAGTCTGGAIQNGTVGVSLTNVVNTSIDRMFIQNTTASGINGTQVNGFTFTNGVIDNSATAATGGSDDANISFNDSTVNANVTGIVTITNNSLTNSRFHGVDIQNYTGTIADANISGNTLTSAASLATSNGSAVRIIGVQAAANLTKAELNNNIITNFPQGAGFVIQGNGGNVGIAGSGTNIISVTGNLMDGGLLGVGSQPDRFITAAANISGQGNFNVSNNGTPGSPIKHIDGVGIELSAFGTSTVTATISNNNLALGNAVASPGIAPGADDTAVLTATISGNTTSLTDGQGIFSNIRNGATGNITIKNNTIAAPNTTSAARAGIQVSSGSAGTFTATVCLDIQGNTTAGSTNTGTSTTSPGIALRKQASTNPAIFGIEGMAATSTPGVENYVNGLNTSASGTFGVGGTALLSGTTGFSNCSSAP